MRTSIAAAGAALAILAAAAGAETTKSWTQSSYDELRRGRADNVAISSDGKLSLGPRLEELYEAPASYLWDLASDAEGNVFVAAGPEAKVFRIGADSRKSVFFETEGIEVHALAVDSSGNVYAATAPQSRIYRIDPSGRSSLFYDPRAAYVWDMVFGPDGDLFVATGDEGKIHRVKPNGEGAVYYETGETHVRSLALDGEGRLIAGGDPGGLILRISDEGSPEAFVLYQSPRKEITALVAAADGTVYAAGVGLRTAAPAAQQPQRPPAAANQRTGASRQATTGSARPLQSPPPATIVTQVRGGSSVVKIAPDGEPREIFSDSTAVVYALALDGEGRPVLATGERGRVFRLDAENRFTLLATLASNQATALHPTADGSILVAASNIGKVYRMGPGPAAEGTFESVAEDADRFARWGRVEWSGDAGEGSISVAARSGNLNRPPRFWSAWSAEADTPAGAATGLPGARYAQWRAKLTGGEGDPPVLDSVTLFYRPANVAPRITEIDLVEANYRFPPRRSASGGVRTLSLPPLGATVTRRGAAQTGAQTLAFSQGFQGVRWTAKDDNADALRYRVEIRGEGESAWFELEDELQARELSFDTTAFADGLYRLRITASDALANPVGEGLTRQRVSEPFLVDNTAPTVSDLQAERDGDRLRVSFEAADAATNIERAEVSVNGGPWKTVLPEHGLFDSREPQFSVELEAPRGTEAVVAVRAMDERENGAAAKTVVR